MGTDPGNTDLSVNIPDWTARFGHLNATCRGFLEAHPDRFTVIPGDDDSFTVDLAAGFWMKEAGDSLDIERGSEDEALCEILGQLADPKNTKSKVWIGDWTSRFGHLAPTSRIFMEKRPDRFIVKPGKFVGDYTVELNLDYDE